MDTQRDATENPKMFKIPLPTPLSASFCTLFERILGFCIEVFLWSCTSFCLLALCLFGRGSVTLLRQAQMQGLL